MNLELAQRIMDAVPYEKTGRYELLPITREVDLFNDIVKYLSAPFNERIDYVVAPESVGWLLGIAMANELNVGFIPIRKSGKLPYQKDLIASKNYVDYSKKEKGIEIKKDLISRGNRVLIVDDWIETGACIKCCKELLLELGIDIIGLASICVRPGNETKAWIESRYLHFIATSNVFWGDVV